MREWKQRFICGRSKEVPKIWVYGVRETVEETAGPGYIKMNQKSKFSFRNTILHAMTHACKPDSPKMLSEPIRFKDGLIVGYQGAAIMVKLRNGQQSFRKMEEGLCERNASSFSGYSVPNRRYFAVGKLARQHFPKEQDPMTLIQNNDVHRLAAIILNKTEASPSDVEKVMDLYQKAWSAQETDVPQYGMRYVSKGDEVGYTHANEILPARSKDISIRIEECAEYARAMVDNDNKSEWKAYADKIKSICPGMGFECKTFYNHPEKNKCEPFKLDSEHTFFRDTKYGFPQDKKVDRTGESVTYAHGPYPKEFITRR